MTDRDHEQLAALETERAFLLENGKTDRAGQVDAQIASLRDRIDAARAANEPETTRAEQPPETTKARRKPTRRKPTPTAKDDAGS
jgi:hypothetical protein